jgi:hypothetical protein
MNEAETRVMQLEQKRVSALDKAETLIFHSDFCPYLELKELLPDASSLARSRFRSLFTNYYGLNTGGLTDEFKNRFFKILFVGKVIVDGRPDFSSILTELSRIRRKKGDYAMPFSFVSKLVAMHLETSPIYDRHVLAFFNEKAPAASGTKGKRIDWYVKFLGRVSASYIEWATDKKVVMILDRLRNRDSRLNNCNVVRLLDFLVWKAGNQKLLRE